MNKNPTQSILIYGGTFDPPHKGHLETALKLQSDLNFDKVLFIPCKKPVLKQAHIASADDRIHMLKLMLADHHELEIDTREIDRKTPSYMVDTLQDLRKEFGSQTSLSLVIGTDAFLDLPKWHQWKSLIIYCNLIVIKRPVAEGKEVSVDLKNFIRTHLTDSKKQIKERPAGHLLFFDAGVYEIASTTIRKMLQDGFSTSKYLSNGVMRYIEDHGLYKGK